MRDTREGLEHLVDGGNGEVVAIGEMDALERVAVGERLNGGVGDVVDLCERANVSRELSRRWRAY